MPLFQIWDDPGFKQAELSVTVLRLDLLHPTISGNKWLKLKGYAQLAQATNKVGILTKGGPWSNHVHACAYTCKRIQLSCHIQIKGREDRLTDTLQDCIKWGATIEFVNRSSFYNETEARELADRQNLLYVPMGGAGSIGIESTSDWFNNLDLDHYTHCFCSVGTATTFAGMAFGKNTITNLIGIESGTNDEAISRSISIWQEEIPKKKLSLLKDYTMGGFSKYTMEQIEFMNTLNKDYQIPSDIVYTGKLFYAVKDLFNKGHFISGDRVLIIHSGGLQGNRSLPESILQF